MKGTWSTAKASCLLLLQLQGTLAAWFIYSMCMGVDARGFGKGGGRGKSPNKPLKCHSFGGAAVRAQLSETALL